LLSSLGYMEWLMMRADSNSTMVDFGSWTRMERNLKIRSANYLDYIGEHVEDWSYLKFPFYLKMGCPKECTVSGLSAAQCR